MLHCSTVTYLCVKLYCFAIVCRMTDYTVGESLDEQTVECIRTSWLKYPQYISNYVKSAHSV